MHKAIVFALILVIAPLATIAIWYRVHTGQIEAERDQYVDWAQKQKMVPVELWVKAPAETPKDQTLYLSGSAPELGAWDAAGVAMKKEDDGRYRATLEVMSGVEHGFKVTRGTWGTVERGPGGEEVPNHVLLVDSPGNKVEVSVASWVDHGQAVPGKVTMTGDIRLHKKFHSDLLNNDRTIVVYLPPNYEADKSARYPVLYMQDGQNLFDESTSFNGIEWKVDETAQKLITDGNIPPIIIVGIYNTEQRTAEFTPPTPGLTSAATQRTSGPRGDLYGRFVVDELKPFIDKKYRTLADRENTALAGSSMGGLITLYMAQAQSKSFGKVAVLTPWLMNQPAVDGAALKSTKVWIDMSPTGGANYPGSDPMADARTYVKSLESAGLESGKNYQFLEVTGEHNEPAWASRMDKVLIALFPKK